MMIIKYNTFYLSLFILIIVIFVIIFFFIIGTYYLNVVNVKNSNIFNLPTNFNSTTSSPTNSPTNSSTNFSSSINLPSNSPINFNSSINSPTNLPSNFNSPTNTQNNFSISSPIDLPINWSSNYSINSPMYYMINDISSNIPASISINSQIYGTSIQPNSNITSIQPNSNITSIQPNSNITSIQPNSNITSNQPNSNITSINGWKCINNIAIGTTIDKDVACLSDDKINCKKFNSTDACNNFISNNHENNYLVCGYDMFLKHGITGYNTENHWCLTDINNLDYPNINITSQPMPFADYELGWMCIGPRAFNVTTNNSIACMASDKSSNECKIFSNKNECNNYIRNKQHIFDAPYVKCNQNNIVPNCNDTDFKNALVKTVNVNEK